MADKTRKEEADAPVECSQGLSHLWFGFQNPRLQVFQTFHQKQPIQKVSLGQKHCAFLTAHGQVFTYGNNYSGQLGCGSYDDHYLEPVLVEELCDYCVVDVSCGKWHSAAVTSSGLVFCWGSSTQGQCGNQLKNNPLPVRVALHKLAASSDVNVQASNTTKDTSQGLAALRDFTSKSMQSNHGQGTLNDKLLPGLNTQNVPDVKDAFEESGGISVMVVQVGCGESHTLAVCDQGELWGWGSGSYLGLNISENTPCSVPRRIDFMMGRKVIKISCGERHTLSLVQKLPLSSQIYRRSSHVPDNQLHAKRKPKGRKDSVGRQSSNEEQRLSVSATCEKCNSPVRNPTGSVYRYEEDTLHVCPLGLEIRSDGQPHQSTGPKIGKSHASRLSFDSHSLDTDSTCSEVDPLGGAVYQTAESSPVVEHRRTGNNQEVLAGLRSNTSSSSEDVLPGRYEDVPSENVSIEGESTINEPVAQVGKCSGDIAEGSDPVRLEEKDDVSLDELNRDGVPDVQNQESFVSKSINEADRMADEVGKGVKNDTSHKALSEEDIMADEIGNDVKKGASQDNITMQQGKDSVERGNSKEDIMADEIGNDVKKCGKDSVQRSTSEEDIMVSKTKVDIQESQSDNIPTVTESQKQRTVLSSDYVNIRISSSQVNKPETDTSSQIGAVNVTNEQTTAELSVAPQKVCDIESAIVSYEHDIGNQNCDDQKYCVLEFSNSEFQNSSEADDIPLKNSSRDIPDAAASNVCANATSNIPDANFASRDAGSKCPELIASSNDDGIQADDILRQTSGSTKSQQLSARDSSDSLVGSLTKSRSTFMDETEAKEFLDRQLSGDDVLVVEATTEGSITGDLTKKVENILQYVPSTSTALAMQEYVKSWTNNVVTNIRSQVETTMDKFGIVSSLGASMDVEEVKAQISRESQDVEQARESVPSVLGNFQRFGSLPKSTSMGGVNIMKSPGEKGQHKRRGSLPSGAIQADQTAIFSSGEVVLETEVWSWGDGGQGQLGHGDTLHRLQPCKIKFFNDKKVVDICAGNFHSLVRTAHSQVYNWGCNSSGQLGHDDIQGSTSPHKVKLAPDCAVSDMAAGENHSILLADGQDLCPSVYYSGTEPGKQGTKEDDSVAEFTCIQNLQKVGLTRAIYSGGDLCCCISDRQTSNHRPILHEFAASERLFGLHLHLISEELLKPLLSSDAFQSKDSSQLGMSLGLLCDAFFCLSDMTCQNHLELQKVLGYTRDLTKLQLLSKSEQCIGAYQHYCKCYTDVLAIGGFKTSAKLCSSLFTKSKELICTVLEAKSFHSKDIGATFLKLMKLPLLRLKDYCKILSRLTLKFSSFTREKQVLDASSRLWETFRQISVQDVKQAENTDLFWSTCPTKLSETLKVASRRLLFDSKTSPLNYQGGGRFTSHLFLLFNDIFAHVQGSYINTYPLSTIWLETATNDKDLATGNFIKLTMPEDSLTVVAPSPMLKSEWIWAFNQAIDKALSQQKYSNDSKASGLTLSPPRDRHASHKFTKHTLFKDAKYEGMWRLGYMHGQGELQWPDGRRFHGAFKHGCQDGYGVYTVQQEESGEKEVFDGVWRQGKLCGYGYVRYANGDSYEGHFRESKRHGHGVLKQGKLTSALASIYIGEWAMDKKSGYGVYEDILKGQKYMGLWLEDQKHGNGVIVTLDGMYFEGTFQQNKMTGYGLLMTDDNTCYEGEFAGGPNLYGKGTLTLPNGDYIEGTFNGSFTEGIKTNGTFFKAPEDASTRHGFSHALGIKPKSFGRLSVPAHRKWEEIFDQCCSMLGCTKHSSSTDSFKAWEKSAALIDIGKKMASGSARASKGKSKVHSMVPAELETIPEYSKGHLSIEYYTKIKSYITKAFEWPHHPLGRLLESLVDVYRATYVGVGAHPRLLHHAVQEVHSFLERVYPIVRILFPDLPDGSSLVQIVRENYDEAEGFQQSEEETCEVVTPGSLLYPILLPKIYPPLFTLYALYNEKEDERYWRRVVTWNKQSDLALMSYLGIDQRFWTFEEHNMESPQRLSKIRDKSYVEAIETLQGISTSFSPADKLYLIQNTFNRINKVVHDKLGCEYLWCMDDLFPVFQYVVVRSRIQHLGAEIHFMDDLMESYLEHGELGLMFTTLKASYYQIQNEKIA